MRLLLAIALCATPFVGGFAAYVHYAAQPEDTHTCNVFADTNFKGQRVTVRDCYSGPFQMRHTVVVNDTARLVGLCDGKILYLNEEDHFPAPCDWIERTPSL